MFQHCLSNHNTGNTVQPLNEHSKYYLSQQDKVFVRIYVQCCIKESSCLVINIQFLNHVVVLLTSTATPNPSVTKVSFIPSTKTRETDPPELILSFSVTVAPPTYVTCQVNSTPMDVAVLFREVITTDYQPSIFVVPETYVKVTLRTRQSGNYQCSVSAYRASMTPDTNNLTDATTLPISILGEV